LEQRGEATGPIGVYGISYGATTAIMLGARDPRVRCIVAVAPFATMRTIIPHFATLFVPLYEPCAAPGTLDRLVDARAREAGFDPDQADAVEAAARPGAPLLILHGSDDAIVPASQSELIAQAAMDAGRIVHREVIPATGHVTIYLDVFGRVSRETDAWFERYMTTLSRAPATKTTEP
jgi:dienelactone hydrolase